MALIERVGEPVMTSPTVEAPSDTGETPTFTELTDSELIELQDYKDKLVGQVTQSLAEANALLGSPLTEIKELPLVAIDGIPMPPELPEHSQGFLPLAQFSEYRQRGAAYWEENKKLFKGIFDANDELYKKRGYSPNQRGTKYHFGIHKTCERYFVPSSGYQLKIFPSSLHISIDYATEQLESLQTTPIQANMTSLELGLLRIKIEGAEWSLDSLKEGIATQTRELQNGFRDLSRVFNDLKKCANWAVKHQQENKQWRQELNPVKQTNATSHCPQNNEDLPPRGNQTSHHQSAFEKCKQSEVLCDWLIKKIKYLESKMARLNKRLKLYSSSLFSCSRDRETTNVHQPATSDEATPLIPLHPKKIT